MTKIRITTTQNIDIEYKLATVFERMLAWMIDFLIIICIGILVILGVILITGRPGNLIAAFLTPVALYHLVSEWLLNGRSLGKMALNLKVVRLNGSTPNFAHYMVRWIVRGIETMPFVLFGAVGVGSIMLSPKGQRLGDIMAGTTVIRTERTMSITDTIFSRTGDDYQPNFPGVKDFSDRDINTLREVLRLYRKEHNSDVLFAAANRVCHALKIVPPANMDAHGFLRSVIRDYNYLH